MQNLLRVGYEKIPLLTSIIYWGDYRITLKSQKTKKPKTKNPKTQKPKNPKTQKTQKPKKP